MGNHLSVGERILVALLMAVVAVGAGGFFFLSGAVLELKDALPDLRVDVTLWSTGWGTGSSVTDTQEGLTGLYEEVATCRAEVSQRFDAVDGGLSVIEAVVEAHHGPLPRLAN